MGCAVQQGLRGPGPPMVPGAGLEPARSWLRGILSPLRLPVSPSRHPLSGHHRERARPCQSASGDQGPGPGTKKRPGGRGGSGGGTRNRTGDNGFADRRLTAWLCRLRSAQVCSLPAVMSTARGVIRRGPADRGKEPLGNEKGRTVGSSPSIWSGRRDSNSRHLPWQGSALPTELHPLETSSTDNSGPDLCQIDFGVPASASRYRAAVCATTRSQS